MVTQRWVGFSTVGNKVSGQSAHPQLEHDADDDHDDGDYSQLTT